jgi:hypothetical protein
MSTLYNIIEAGALPIRLRGAVSLAWSLFAKKVGSELIHWAMFFASFKAVMNYRKAWWMARL